MLKIKNLSVNIGEKSVLKKLNLDLPKGEIHVLMGPNGAGKSTLGNALMGHPSYHITEGEVLLEGEDLLALDTAQRAKSGLFLAFQYPVAIPGLRISEYLRTLYTNATQEVISVADFRKRLRHELETLEMDKGLLQRYLNDGLSGGEMKRLQMLELSLLKPKIAVLDEIDSGVDIDGQKIVAHAIERATREFGTSFLLVTHYQRLLKIVKPSKIHVLLDGGIVNSGGFEIVENLEKGGYQWFKENSV